MGSWRYRPLSGLWASFCDPGFYQHVRESWRGIGYLYFLFLCLLSSVTLSVAAYFSFSAKIGSPEFSAIIFQLPRLTLKNGVLASAADQPVAVVDPQTKQIWLVVDTADRFSSPDQVGSRFLLNSKSLKLKTKDEVKSVEYVNFAKNAEIDPARIPDQIKGLFGLFVAVMTVVLFAMDSIFGLLKACLVAGIIKLCRSQHSYKTILRLIFVCWTPNMIVATALSASGQENLVTQVVGAVVAVVYLFLGFKWARSQQ